MSEIVLVVAVHPDDETLGCGGTLLRHLASGDAVHWCLVTGISEAGGWPPDVVARREDEIRIVVEYYGFAGVHRLGFPAPRLSEQPLGDVVQALGDVVRAVGPTTLYLPFLGDAHSDHRIAFQAAYTCAKWFRYPSIRRVLAMETPSETDFAPPVGQGFAPNVFVDVSVHFKGKLEAMRLYGQELGDHPFPRSERGMEALAVTRGAVCGCEYAEAFMLLKEIRR
ncbi:PIG-L deacetylase family protein [Desulfocurvus sp. DL9XJH121]